MSGVGQLAPEHVLDRHLRALADGVGDARLEADGDGLIEGLRLETPEGADLQHRIGELRDHPPRLVGAQIGLDAIDVTAPHAVDREAEEAPDRLRDTVSAWVGEPWAQADLDAMDGERLVRSVHESESAQTLERSSFGWNSCRRGAGAPRGARGEAPPRRTGEAGAYFPSVRESRSSLHVASQ